MIPQSGVRFAGEVMREDAVFLANRGRARYQGRTRCLDLAGRVFHGSPQ
jgi:hypothetical protein